MKPGSVIVDMAAEHGGNCTLSESGKTVTKYGVHIIGDSNLATLVAADASALYSRNVLDFLRLIIDTDANLAINREDEIVAATLLCAGGEIVWIEGQLCHQQQQAKREQYNANDVAQPPRRARLLCIFASHAQRVTNRT